MIGFCEQCGCAIYTPDDIGVDDTTLDLINTGATPLVMREFIEKRHLVCMGCVIAEEQEMEAFLQSDEFKLECEIEKTLRALRQDRLKGATMAKDKKIIVWGNDGRQEIIADLLHDGIKFLNKARSKSTKEIHAIGLLLFDPPHLVATDGHRIHCFVVDEEIFTRDHHYEVINITSTEAHLGDIGELKDTFRDGWRRVWPDGLYTALDGSYATSGRDMSESYTKIIRHMEADETINFAYYKDLALMEHCEVGFYCGNPVFKAGKMGAVILPAKVE